ncbi:MAG: hypothetical protein ACI8WB_001043 [Phenylobacterium sp.]|jgi:hypothetical protein
MRWLGRLLVLVLFAILALNVFDQPLQWQGWGKNTVGSWDQDFSAYPVFWLDADNPLEFDIPANAAQLRVQLTPALTSDLTSDLAADVAAEGQASALYSVAYRTADQAGQTIGQANRVFAQSDIAEAASSDENNRFSDRFFNNPDGQVAQFTSGFFVDNLADNPVASLQIGLKQDPGFAVAVRVSVLERKKEGDLPVLWHRMRRDRRAALMAEHIYPPELVSDEEKRTALRYSWLPIGPVGTQGQHYQTATLFIRDKTLQANDGQSGDDQAEGAANEAQAVAQAAQMLASEDKVFTFLPSAFSQPVASLQCHTLDGSALAWLEVTMQQNGQHNSQQSSQQKIIYRGDKLNSAILLPNIDDDGRRLVEIRSAKMCAVALADEQGKNINIAAKVIRAYQVKPQQPLSYALALNSQQSQPIRLDIRALSASTNAGGVKWRVLSQQGQVLLSGELALSFEQDRYEALPAKPDELTDKTLYQKQSSYIMAPKHSATLVVESLTEQALVNVLTRPLKLSYLVDEQQPKWFMALPKAHQRLKANGDSQLIYWQQKPLVDQVVDGQNNQWAALSTIDNQPSFELFSPGGSRYQRVPNGRWSRRFANSLNPGQKKLTPTLVYVQHRPSLQPQKVTIELDDRQRVEHWLTAKAGRFSLPTLVAGRHRIDIIDHGQVQWFVSDSSDARRQSRPGYRIRQVYRLADKLTFEVEKRAEQEWLSFHYFSITDQAHEIEVSLHHQPQEGEMAEHTVPSLRYHIKAGTGEATNIYVLNQALTTIWSERLLKFPLAADLPLGRYQLSVKSTQPDAGYIQASYVYSDTDGDLRWYSQAQ